MVAALAIQHPRERPLEKQQAADEKTSPSHDEHSDFLALLKLWDYYHEQARQLSRKTSCAISVRPIFYPSCECARMA
ncbi:MAG: hypothetical protein U1F42_09375 [Candidatus Competibacteraceae bacterium]